MRRQRVKRLDELQAMLSPPRNEEDRFAQLQKNWNVDWDTSRLWVRDFAESKGQFQMSGGAVNADDVAEFFQRLTTAKHFKKAKLAFVRATKAKGAGPRLVDFEISGVLTYTGELPKAEASGKKKKRKR